MRLKPQTVHLLCRSNKYLKENNILVYESGIIRLSYSAFILEEKSGRAVPFVCVSRIADEKFGFLLEAANVNDENKIVMTTHSPYVLSYITLAAKSYELMNKGVKWLLGIIFTVVLERLLNLIPIEKWLVAEKWCWLINDRLSILNVALFFIFVN